MTQAPTSKLNLRMRKDYVAIREILVTPETESVILAPDAKEANRTQKHLTGIVEGIGDKVTLCAVGDLVYFELNAGCARVPGDFAVRIMREADVCAVAPPPETQPVFLTGRL